MQENKYEITCSMKFQDDQWKVVRMLMDYCNNLGLMKEAMMEIAVKGNEIIITTQSQDTEVKQ